MGAQASKDEHLYMQVSYGNIPLIKHLHGQGAGLEFTDKQGKTPLIVACTRPDLLPVAEVLIDLGANVNAYRPGSHGWTPLHHAAARGLEQAVRMLLSHGANPSVVNDDCQTPLHYAAARGLQEIVKLLLSHEANPFIANYDRRTPLDMARINGHTNIVRIIENHVSVFCERLREIDLPSFLQDSPLSWASKTIWAVVIPRDHQNSVYPSELELAIYPNLQAAQPKAVLQLCKAKLEAPDFRRANPILVIIDNRTRTRFGFSAEHAADKEQISRFYNACRGVYQGSSLHQPAPILPSDAPETSSFVTPSLTSEDLELAMAMNASIESAIAEGIPSQQLPVVADTGWLPETSRQHQDAGYNSWPDPDPNAPAHQSVYSESSSQHEEVNYNASAPPEPFNIPLAQDDTPPQSLLLAPSISHRSPNQYVLIDNTDLKLSSKGKQSHTTDATVIASNSSSCVICLDAPVEGACIPCGHMAGCMACLNEVKGNNWGCPICRARIDQVIKFYVV